MAHPPSLSGINNGPIGAMPMAGRFSRVQALAPGEAQSEIATPLMITNINHGLVFTIPAEPPFVTPADEQFAIAPEYG